MPLPASVLTITGSCNCAAIRYRVSIPPLDERPLHPLSPAEGTPVPLPFIVLDHCNDCRRATGSLLPAWLCAPIAICTVSLVTASLASHAPQAAARHDQLDESRGSWIAATDVFTSNATNSDHFLANYESSNERWRWFCRRCGTSIAYTAVMPEAWPDMLDITLGSVERGCLDKDAMVPESHLWWDCGIGWVRKLATEGLGGVPVHGDYRIGETAEMD
jgi:hypothetical protein